MNKAYDMSEFWRIISNDGDRIRGDWKVARPKSGNAWINAIDVVIWNEGHSSGRILHFGDLTAEYRDGEVSLAKHMIAINKLADVEDVWDEMLETIKAVAEAEWK